MKKRNLILTLLAVGVTAAIVPAIVVPVVNTTQNSTTNIIDNNAGNNNGSGSSNGDNNQNNGGSSNGDNNQNNGGSSNGDNNQNNGNTSGNENTNDSDANLSLRDKAISQLVKNINKSSLDEKRSISASLLSSNFKLMDTLTKSQKSDVEHALQVNYKDRTLLSSETVPSIDTVTYDATKDVLVFNFSKSFDYSGSNYVLDIIPNGNSTTYQWYSLNTPNMKIEISLNKLDIKLVDGTYKSAQEMADKQKNPGITLGYIFNGNKKTVGITTNYRDSQNFLKASDGVGIRYYFNQIQSNSNNNTYTNGKNIQSIAIDNIGGIFELKL